MVVVCWAAHAKTWSSKVCSCFLRGAVQCEREVLKGGIVKITYYRKQIQKNFQKCAHALTKGKRPAQVCSVLFSFCLQDLLISFKMLRNVNMRDLGKYDRSSNGLRLRKSQHNSNIRNATNTNLSNL